MNKLFNLFGFGLTKVFKDNDGNDVNNPNASGGDDPNKGGGGGGSDNKGQNDAKDQTYEITVDGEKRRVTVDEMRDLAQKSAGADKKFQEASQLRKDAQDGLRLKELVTRLSDGSHEPTETEVRELAGMIGVNPDEFDAFLKVDDDDDDKDKNKGNQGGISEEEFDRAYTARFGISPAEAKQREEFRHANDIEAARKEIERLSGEAVDKDEFFGKIKIGEKGGDRIALAKEMVAEDVLKKVQRGEPFGAELRAASVQKIRAYFEKFGIPGKPEQYPIALGLGPSGGLPAEVNSEEPIQRVKVTDEGAEDNFAARFLQRGLKKLREANHRR